jgi:hypothetical protein
MNKKSLLWIILDLIFLIVFNVVFFVAGGMSHPASVWIAYAFIHIAYILLLITPFLIREGSSKAIFGASLYSISSAYFLLEFIVGIVFIFLKSDSYKASLIVQVVLAGLYGVLLVSHMIANETTADSVAEHEHELVYVKTCSGKLKGVLDSVSDKALRKKVERAYDVLHGSPVKSNHTVSALEQQVDSLIDELREAVDSGNNDSAAELSDRIVRVAEDRNRQLKSQN